MPKRKLKIPVATGVGFNFWEALTNLEADGSIKPYRGPAPDFTIDSAKWKQIELEYGHGLSSDMRQEILQVTRRFIEADETERRAEPLAESQSCIESYKKALQRFRVALLTTDQSDTNAYAQLHILQAARQLGGGENVFEHLIRAMYLFDVSCDEALRRMKNDIPLEPAWVGWVKNLARIMEDNGLPITVRKDASNKSRSDKQSAFTRFVQALQACLPTECNLPYAESGLPTRLRLALRAEDGSGPIKSRIDPE